MIASLLAQLSVSLQNLDALLLLLNALLHILFAGGIAHDIGNLNRNNISTRFAGGYTWVLATLLGGLLVVVAYWLMHHSTLAKRS